MIEKNAVIVHEIDVTIQLKVAFLNSITSIELKMGSVTRIAGKCSFGIIVLLFQIIHLLRLFQIHH